MIQRTRKFLSTNQYQVTWPKDTHWRRATCAEVDCPRYLLGWTTTVEADSPQYDFVRADKERHYRAEVTGEGLITLHYPAGQRCFGSDHWLKLERGPWLTRDLPRLDAGRVEHNAMEPERWLDEFNAAAEQIGK